METLAKHFGPAVEPKAR